MFGSLVSTLESSLIAGASSGAATVYGLAQAGLTAGIALYMLLACLAVLRGIAGEGFGHVVTQGLKASLVWAALTGALVGDPVALANSIPITLGAGDANIGATADNYINQVWSKATQIVAVARPEEGGLSSFADIGQALWWAVASVLLYAVAVIPVLIAYIFGAVIVTIGIFLKFALAITAAFAPLFVALILYDSTRGMFFQWLGAALGYGISLVVIGIVAAAFLTLVPAVVGSIDPPSLVSNEDVVLQGLLQLLALSGIGIVGIAFLMQAQGIGQAIGGGGGGSGAGVVGALIPSLYTTRTALSLGRRAAGRVGAGAAGARRAAASTARSAKARLQTFRGNGSARAGTGGVSVPSPRIVGRSTSSTASTKV